MSTVLLITEIQERERLSVVNSSHCINILTYEFGFFFICYLSITDTASNSDHIVLNAEWSAKN
jgi:hypothetical protein